MYDYRKNKKWLHLNIKNNINNSLLLWRLNWKIKFKLQLLRKSRAMLQRNF